MVLLWISCIQILFWNCSRAEKNIGVFKSMRLILCERKHLNIGFHPYPNLYAGILFHDFRRNMWEFLFLRRGFGGIFEGDHYVIYRGPKCVSDDYLWCLGAIGTCLNNFRHRWVVRIYFSLSYSWRFSVKMSRFELLWGFYKQCPYKGFTNAQICSFWQKTFANMTIKDAFLQPNGVENVSNMPQWPLHIKINHQI